MNLLPKKSWHVGKKENIEKVFRDELDARIAAEKLAHKKLLADKQDQLASLRHKKTYKDFKDIELEKNQLNGLESSSDNLGPAASTRFELFSGPQGRALFHGNTHTGTTSTGATKKSEAEKLKEKIRINSQSEKFSDVLKSDRAFNPFALRKLTKDSQSQDNTYYHGKFPHQHEPNRGHPGRPPASGIQKRRSQLDREDPLALMPKKGH